MGNSKTTLLQGLIEMMGEESEAAATVTPPDAADSFLSIFSYLEGLYEALPAGPSQEKLHGLLRNYGLAVHSWFIDIRTLASLINELPPKVRDTLDVDVRVGFGHWLEEWNKKQTVTVAPVEGVLGVVSVN